LELKQETFQIIKKAAKYPYNSWVLVEFIRKAAPYLTNELGIEAWSIVQDYEYIEPRVKASCSLINFLLPDLRSQFFPRLFEDIISLKEEISLTAQSGDEAQARRSEFVYAQILARLAPLFPNAIDTKFLKEAFRGLKYFWLEQDILQNRGNLSLLVEPRLMWCNTLRILSGHTREFLLEHIAEIAIMIEYLGGDNIPRETFIALEDATKWWP
jgi:hypothetical protein